MTDAGEDTPLTLAEAGRAGEPAGSTGRGGGSETASWWRARTARSPRASATLTAMLVACVGDASVAAWASGARFAHAPALGFARNRVHRAEDGASLLPSPEVSRRSDVVTPSPTSAEAGLGAAPAAEAGLGAASDACPRAFFAPKKRGSVDHENSTYSHTLSGVVKYADAVYILCTTECDRLVVPEDWGDVVTMVDGYALDRCYHLEDQQHWVKASQMHMRAMQHAFDGDATVETVAILEQDTRGDDGVGWNQQDWYDLETAMRETEWSLLRMAYRPFEFEDGRAMASLGGDAACPEQCRCERATGNICVVRSAGCALQSADAYLVHRRAYPAMTASLSQGRVIDYDVFREMKGQVLITPALSYQTTYSIAPDQLSVEDARRAIERFVDRCAKFPGEEDDARRRRRE